MRRPATAAAAVLLICAAAACRAVGPDWTPPATDVPASWSGAGAGRPALSMWWTNFDDPTLASLMDRALSSNLDLAQARARIREARAARAAAEGGLWPQVDAAADARRGRGVSTQSDASTTSGGVRSLFRAGLDAVWEIDVFGGRRRAVEAADADLDAAVEDLRDVQVTLAGEVGLAYMELRGFQREAAVAKRSIEAERRAADIARRRHDAGFASGLDVAQAETLAATTLAEAAVLESSSAQTVHRLSVLLGLEPTALSKELSAAKPVPKAAPELPLGLPSDLLRRRPDIRRVEAQLHASTARIGVATADLFPKFSLVGSVGVAGDRLSSLDRTSGRTWSIGPSASWALFDAGRARAAVDQADAARDETFALYRKTVLAALEEVEDALVAYEKERERHAALEQAASQGAKAVELAAKLYAEGQTDGLTVVSTQRALYAAEDAAAQSDRAIAADVVAVYKALGGGW